MGLVPFSALAWVPHLAALAAESFCIMLNHLSECCVLGVIEKLSKIHPELRLENHNKIDGVHLGRSSPLKHLGQRCSGPEF